MRNHIAYRRKLTEGIPASNPHPLDLFLGHLLVAVVVDAGGARGDMPGDVLGGLQAEVSKTSVFVATLRVLSALARVDFEACHRFSKS